MQAHKRRFENINIHYHMQATRPSPTRQKTAQSISVGDAGDGAPDGGRATGRRRKDNRNYPVRLRNTSFLLLYAGVSKSGAVGTTDPEGGDNRP